MQTATGITHSLSFVLWSVTCLITGVRRKDFDGNGTYQEKINFFSIFLQSENREAGIIARPLLLVIAHRFGACRCRFSQMGASVDNRAAPNSKLAADRGRRRPRRGRSIRQLPLREAQLCNCVRPKPCSGSAGRAISRRRGWWT